MSVMDSSGSSSKSDFKLLELIGKGSFGSVQKALDLRTNKIVAIKQIDLVDDWVPLLTEVNMVIDLHHETIVNYYSWFFEEKMLWIVMEYCDGGSLSDILKTIERTLTEQEVCACMRGLLESLEMLHKQNRIHRDIKCGNLLLTSDGLIKLCDFGVSAQLEDFAQRTGTVTGSPYYMAPEVILATGHNTKADIWSTGITALELINGKPPLHEIQPMVAMLQIPKKLPPQAPPDSSPEFKDFISKALTKDFEQRASASELVKHPFINSISKTAAQQTIFDLVQEYKTRKESLMEEEEDEEDDEDEEEDDEEEAEAVEEEVDTITEDDCQTILYGSTMVVDEASDHGFTGLQLEFITDKQPQKLENASKRHFRNYTEKALQTMLDGLNGYANIQLKESSIHQETILQNYEECRVSIVAEMRRRGKRVSDDYMKI